MTSIGPFQPKGFYDLYDQRAVCFLGLCLPACLLRRGPQRDFFILVISFVVSLELGQFFNICLYDGGLGIGH